MYFVEIFFLSFFFFKLPKIKKKKKTQKTTQCPELMFTEDHASMETLSGNPKWDIALCSGSREVEQWCQGLSLCLRAKTIVS